MTQPKSRGVDSKTDSRLLAHGRYGTAEMIDIWGPERTISYSLKAQSAAVSVLSKLRPDIIPDWESRELVRAASLEVIDPQRIRELEEKYRHDIIAINSAWGEKVSPQSAAHINKLRTSADTTETAKALQLKDSIEIIADSIENLRDITLEKGVEFEDIHIDQTHMFDALPTVAGRPFVFYAEMLQSGLDLFGYVYKNSLKGKWADATGNHHSAEDAGVDGIALQEEYTARLGLGHMTAPAQIPGREFITDVVYALARTAETMQNLAAYISWGFSDDAGIFADRNPKKRKGSSGMPHKDAKGGNRIVEEQTMSFANFMRGALATSLSSCRFLYARDLSGSASDRIILEDAFKFGDHVVRGLAEVVFYLGLNKERLEERVKRSYGIVTAERVLNYLTDIRNGQPMTRDEAHNLLGKAATKAYNEKKDFGAVLAEYEEVTSRVQPTDLKRLTDPMTYIGQSRKIIEVVFDNFHGKKTLD